MSAMTPLTAPRPNGWVPTSSSSFHRFPCGPQTAEARSHSLYVCCVLQLEAEGLSWMGLTASRVQVGPGGRGVAGVRPSSFPDPGRAAGLGKGTRAQWQQAARSRCASRAAATICENNKSRGPRGNAARITATCTGGGAGRGEGTAPTECIILVYRQRTGVPVAGPAHSAWTA